MIESEIKKIQRRKPGEGRIGPELSEQEAKKAIMALLIPNINYQIAFFDLERLLDVLDEGYSILWTNLVLRASSLRFYYVTL